MTEEGKPKPKKWTEAQKFLAGAAVGVVGGLTLEYLERQAKKGHPYMMLSAYRHRLTQGDVETASAVFSGGRPFGNYV